MKKDEGILYISTGKAYNAETMRSARSAKELMPSVPIALFTDEQPCESDIGLFESIKIIESPRYSFFDKILPLKETPFNKTLFVDSDTVFLQPVTELFELLDRFDLAYCHGPWRQCPGENNRLEDVPDCFVEANTGVLAYNACDSTFGLIDSWEAIYSNQLKSETPPSHDQPAFRKAVYSSSAISYVLPPEYNLRTPMPMFKGGGISAKILHGRGYSLEKALAGIDRGPSIGLFDFTKTKLMPKRLLFKKWKARTRQWFQRS